MMATTTLIFHLSWLCRENGISPLSSPYLGVFGLAHGDLADGNSGVQTSHGQDHPSSRSTVFSRENHPFSIAILNDRRVVTGYSAI
jgi:hypothetical protein